MNHYILLVNLLVFITNSYKFDKEPIVLGNAPKNQLQNIMKKTKKFK